MLWHGSQPIGICIFATPAASLKLRTKHFGLTNPRDRVALSALNAQLWVLQRVVLHPTYRGAGIAAAFVRMACDGCPVDWIETLSAMGRVNPFFERAGFRFLGIIRKDASRNGGSGAYGSRRRAAPTTHVHSEPAYYLFDNRRRAIR